MKNKELRTQIAILAGKLATETLDPLTLEAYVSCRLIPLDKNPGVRPIGVGEVLCRMVGKCVGWVLKVRQVCLADDISGAGSLDDLIIWWKNVISEGKKFGYLVNEKKSWLILKDHGNLQEAQRLFSNTGIKLTTDGQRHLGAAIGTSNFRAQYAAEKVTKWCNELLLLLLLLIYLELTIKKFTSSKFITIVIKLTKIKNEW